MDFSPLDFWVPALRIDTDGANNILLRFGKFINSSVAIINFELNFEA